MVTQRERGREIPRGRDGKGPQERRGAVGRTGEKGGGAKPQGPQSPLPVFVLSSCEGEDEGPPRPSALL